MLAAVAALSPVEANAGCNHPWVHRDNLSSSLDDLAPFDSSRQGIDPDPVVPGKSEHRSPCAGGACSRLPDLPMSNSDSIPGPSELWGELPDGAGRSARLSDGIRFFHERPRPVRMTFLIDRPPRMIAPR
jgi:hypothetical protein